MSKHIVVIGAVALGPKAACRFKRLDPKARVTMIDKSVHISYGGCGIPYYVSGDVSDITELKTTSFHMVRDPKFFKDVKGVDVLPRTEAVRIDREAKKVHVVRLDTGVEEVLEYDQLVIGTGSTPRRLNIPGEDLDGVSYVGNPADAERIRSGVSKGEVGSAVIVGAGFIGLEMAEALADMWGVETTVVEIADQIMPGLVGPQLATMARTHMEEQGVTFHLGETLERIEGENGRVTKVVTSKREIEADLVILSAGVLPSDELARAAGLEVGERGGIVVDERMRTSDPDIYAGGDCVLVKHLVSGNPAFLPLGSLSNRQGRVIGTNLAGGDATFDGVVGSFVVKLFETSLAGAGLSLAAARRAGFEAISVMAVSLDRAHFYPTKELMTLELVVEPATRRVLGVQGFGSSGDALVGRVDAVAAILKYAPKVEDISNMELAYSPPFSSAMDVLNTLANVTDNVLAGRGSQFGPQDFCSLWEKRSDDLFFLDCRESSDAAPYMERHPGEWHNIPQGELAGRLDEVPGDKQVVLVCNTGARSYEALVTLTDSGYTGVKSLQGGMAGLKKLGLNL